MGAGIQAKGEGSWLQRRTGDWVIMPWRFGIIPFFPNFISVKLFVDS